MNIRKAVREDIPALQALYRTLFRESAAVAPSQFQEAGQDEQFLRNNMDTEYSLVLVAQVEERVVGFALAQQQLTPPVPCFVEHRYAYLMDLSVAAEYRSRGIGAALIREVEDWARSRGLDHLELNVLADNHGARRLYESLGFREAMLNLKKTL